MSLYQLTAAVESAIEEWAEEHMPSDDEQELLEVVRNNYWNLSHLEAFENIEGAFTDIPILDTVVDNATAIEEWLDERGDVPHPGDIEQVSAEERDLLNLLRSRPGAVEAVTRLLRCFKAPQAPQAAPSPTVPPDPGATIQGGGKVW